MSDAYTRGAGYKMETVESKSEMKRREALQSFSHNTPPIISYPDEVARGWKAEVDAHLETIAAQAKVIEKLKACALFYSTGEFPWSNESEFDNGAMADETLAELTALTKQPEPKEGV